MTPDCRKLVSRSRPYVLSAIVGIAVLFVLAAFASLVPFVPGLIYFPAPVVLLIALWFLLAFPRRAAARERAFLIGRIHCRKCGYDITPTISHRSGTCSECGEPVTCFQCGFDLSASIVAGSQVCPECGRHILPRVA